MIKFFGNIFAVVFGGKSWLATIIISMFPLIELKGAIPVGMSVEFWGINALSEREAFVFSLIGSCLVVPILALVFKPIINFMKNSKLFKKLAVVIENKVKKSSEKINTKVEEGGTASKRKTILKMLGVFSFVAIPLPLTGVWTGTCIGVCLGLKYWQVVVSCLLGNIVAGLLVTFVCKMFPNFTSILFLIVIAIVIVMLVTMIVKLLARKKTKEE